MKSLITIALVCIYGIAWAQTPTNRNGAASQNTTADRIRQENQMSQDQTHQALLQQDGRGVVPRNSSVCIQNDTNCLSQEARNRINQNNGTVRDNPTDLNNRPSY